MRAILLLLAFTLSAALAHGQRAPEAGHAFPPSGKAGTTLEVRLAATDLTPDTRFFFFDPRLKLEVLTPPGPVLMPEPPYWLGIKSYLNDPNLTREVTTRLTIPAGMPAGLVRWGVANASGTGDLGMFLISDTDQVLEEDNKRGAQQVLALPATVCGRLARIEEEDSWQFTAPATGIVTCELMARRLGSDFHPVLRVLDPAGVVVAEQFDTAGLDPVLSFPARQGQKYTVTVRDIDYRGYRSFGYRLTIHPGPRIVSASPSGARRGETREVTFHGLGLATGGASMESVVRPVVFPADPGSDTFAYRLNTPWGTSLPHRFPVGDQPETVATSNTPLGVPGGITGRLPPGAARITFPLVAKKGESIQLIAQSLNPHGGQDLELEIRGADGKPVVDGDDSAGSTNPLLLFNPPADGTYTVILHDRVAARAGLADLYRLSTRKVPPDFRLEIPNTLAFPAATNGALTVKVIRLGGFKEPVTLSLDGLPIGVTGPEAKALLVPATADTLKIELVSAKNAPAAASLVHVHGTAQLAGKTIQRQATDSQKPGWAPWLPDTTPANAVLLATTLKPPFKFKPVEADGGRRVNRGATHQSELIIERTGDFTGEIVLDMSAKQQRHRQGIRGPLVTVAPGVKKLNYPVFMPEGLETTRTSRIGLVGMALVKDPSGAARWITGDMDGQITMSIEGALLKLTGPEEVVVALGGSSELTFRLLRSATLKDPTRLELVLPPSLVGKVRAETLTLPASTQGPLTWRIAIDKAPDMPGSWSITARATTLRDGHPVVSEVALRLVIEPAGK